MRLRSLFVFLLLSLALHFSSSQAQAVTAAEPAKSVYLTDFFRLYRFLPPQEILLYENRDMARKDIKQRIVSDTRPKQGSDCITGNPDACRGEVVLENEESPGHVVTQILPNANGVCRHQVTAGSETGDTGYCDYRKKPTNVIDVTAIDYSKTTDLIFPKLQNRFFSYWNNGGDNEIAWGSDNLSVSAEDQYVRRAITLAQAGQTKETQESTNESPIGGVRWDAPLEAGVNTTNQKTLHDVWQELGEDGDGLAVKNSAKLLLAYWEDMVKPPPVGEEEVIPGAADAIKSINSAISKNLAKPVSEQPAWLQDFLKAPECGPGYDKGYTLVSVCMLGSCTPVSSNEEFVNGNPSFRSQTVYSDPRIRQNLCAAVYNVYQQYPLSEARSIMRKARHDNLLLDCTQRADEACIPSNIEERLSNSADPATYPLAKNKFFSLPWFHKIIDGWRTPDGGFWMAKIDFKLKGGGEYREAGAVESVGILGVLLNEVAAVAQDWIDSVFQALHHTVIIPPLSAHSIDAIENATYLIHETAEQNRIDAEATAEYHNAVSAGALSLSAGNMSAPKNAQRHIGLWSCDNPLFSASWLTLILDYVFGKRVGCSGEDSTTTTVASCSANVSEDQITEVANKVGEKYGIQGSWLAAMWKLEGGTTQMGENCKSLNNFEVMGPLQITEGAYDSVTCDKEHIATPELERTQCASPGKLSRCSLEGSMEIAARVILGKLRDYGYYSGDIDCNATQAAVSGSQLYRAVNAYGACAELEDGTKYAEWICGVAQSCPSPLPPTGAPLSCAGN